MYKCFRWGILAVLFAFCSGSAMAQKKSKRKAPASFSDSATIPGYSFYNAGKFKKWLLGSNYRNEWTHPVRVAVFDISKEQGGLIPEKMGGGKQTKSLRLEDKAGNDYVLRSIEKFPDNTLPEEFRNTFVKDAVVDGISASYPYAALSVPPLARAANISHATPRLVYVPDDPKLGEYRDDFGNTLCIFEEREPGGFEKNINTENVLEKLKNDNDNRIHQQVVLKARLLDMFIMDFDRHDDQWRWGTDDTAEKKTYFPIPRDRDQAFFINNGFIPRLVKSNFPKFQGFRAKAQNIKTFNFNARYFDRTFLNAMMQDDWQKQADTLIMNMTDSVIDLALMQQPKEVYPFSANKIIKTLKDRRKYLPGEALEYYRFLAKEVSIAGSDKREFFEIIKNDDASVLVTIHKVNDDENVIEKLYTRKFFPNETNEIRLYGMAGADRFLITGDNRTPIKVRIIGGSGEDLFENTSKANTGKLFVYDSLSEKNVFKGTGFRKLLANNDSINKYDRTDFIYTNFSSGLSVAFNRDEGVFLGVRFKHTAHGFRKTPYKLRQVFNLRYAMATNAFTSRYNLEAMDVFGKTDLVASATLNLPRNTINFFGSGNETSFRDFNNKSITFYRTRIKHTEVNVLLRQRLFPSFDFNFGPSFSYYYLSRVNNAGRISFFPSLIGADSTTLYKQKTYIGPLTQFIYDNRDDEHFPSRGVYWVTDIRYNKALTKYATDFSHIRSDLSLFFGASPSNKWVFAFRVGGGSNFGSYAFYQSQFLSGTENLRGFRKYRFAGDKMIYNNIEVRFRLANFQTYLFPGAIGVLAFHDAGRVWLKGEKSNTWHNGYGIGLWLAPAKRFVLVASISHSKDGWVPLAGFGFMF